MSDELRALDAAVHTHVFGWIEAPSGLVYVHQETGKLADLRVPHYSTDIAAAWLVVERMTSQGWWLEIDHGGVDWKITFYGLGDDPFPTERADTAPEAICRAALEAVAESG